MQLKLEHCLLYAVTDTSWLRGRTLARQVEEALRGGATMVQLREKKLTGDALEAEINSMLATFGIRHEDVEASEKAAFVQQKLQLRLH